MAKYAVAVVNLDQPVDYAGSTMAVGDELVDNLKESDALFIPLCRCARSKIQWNLLYGNHHPGSSANATTLMDDTPKKMELNMLPTPEPTTLLPK